MLKPKVIQVKRAEFFQLLLTVLKIFIIVNPCSKVRAILLAQILCSQSETGVSNICSDR